MTTNTKKTAENVTQYEVYRDGDDFILMNVGDDCPEDGESFIYPYGAKRLFDEILPNITYHSRSREDEEQFDYDGHLMDELIREKMMDFASENLDKFILMPWKSTL